MTARRLGWGLVVLGAVAVGVVRAEEPAPDVPAPWPIAWSDADARVAQGDAPLYLQVFVGEDGRVALRSTLAGAKPAWRARGAWRLDLMDGKASMDALKELNAALVAIHAEPSTVRLREADQHSRVRLLIDAHPSAPWRYVQWVVMAASNHRLGVYRLAFSTLEPGGWIDNELPRDGSRPGMVTGEPDATALVVKLFRKELERDAIERFTRVRITSEPTDLDDVVEEIEEAVPGAEGPEPVHVTIDLPAGRVESGQHAARWRQVEAALRKLAATGLACVGEIKTPPPTGHAVPYADVAALLVVFDRLECKRVRFEGAPAPLPGKEAGGWGSLGR